MPLPNRIVLVDGYAQVYRAFHGIPGLAGPQGQPTNALYGVARLLLKIDQELPHAFGAVIFDRGRPARRMELLPEYKATRAPMPDDLRAQLPSIHAWLAAAGWPVLEDDGREADDLIAAIVQERAGRETAILSHDKDLAQLVTEDGTVYLLKSGSKDGLEAMGHGAVLEKFGVPPNRLRDYLALLGDSSDNIPGVPGVGAKTAAALLAQFGSAEHLLDHVEDVANPRIRESLRNSAEILRRNLQLVELDLRPPTGWNGMEQIRRHAPDWEKLRELALAAGFKSLLAVLDKHRQAEESPMLF
jgi:DNA polymerase-1